MEQVKLNENEYLQLLRYTTLFEDYEELSTKFLEFSGEDIEPKDLTLPNIVSDKFNGSWGELLKFIQEYSSIKTIARVYGTYSVSGYSEVEVEDGNTSTDANDYDFDVSDEYQLEDLCDTEFTPEGGVEIESNIRMIPFSAYEESLSTPEKKVA